MNKSKSTAKAAETRRSRRLTPEVPNAAGSETKSSVSDSPGELAVWHQLKSAADDVLPRYRRD